MFLLHTYYSWPINEYEKIIKTRSEFKDFPYFSTHWIEEEEVLRIEEKPIPGDLAITVEKVADEIKDDRFIAYVVRKILRDRYGQIESSPWFSDLDDEEKEAKLTTVDLANFITP
jgi:hypothetical protein